MSTSDWINAVIATLALVGVGVAVWAVVLTERSTRSAYASDRFDVVVDCASEITLLAREMDAAMLPLWSLSDEEYGRIELHNAAVAENPETGNPVLAPKAKDVDATIQILHATIVTLEALDCKLAVLLVTLPRDLQELHSADIRNQVAWLQACAMVSYLSVVNKESRERWALPKAHLKVVRDMDNYYSSTDGSSSSEFLERAKDLVSGLNDRRAVGIAAELLRQSTLDLRDVMIATAASLELKRAEQSLGTLKKIQLRLKRAVRRRAAVVPSSPSSPLALVVLKAAKWIYCIALGVLAIWAFASSTGEDVKSWNNRATIEDADGFRTMVVIFFTLLLAVSSRDGWPLVRELIVGTGAFLALVFQAALLVIAPDWSEIYLTLVLLITIAVIAWNNSTRTPAASSSSVAPAALTVVQSAGT